ncbi:MAG: aldo/keto reductase, partial [Firmicutes bacterium]|nr:aldo/keto reductase [Bacillota bacterium]
MIYKEFQDKKLSQLGFGTMRLPLNEDGSIDEAQVVKMTDWAMEQGVNYFDTAYPYHGGNSERVIGRALAKYPRESFYLA